jgi:hypothetical protein
MNLKRLNTYYFNSSAHELNTQKNPKCRSNSLLHKKNTTNKEYNNCIYLSPLLGELKMDIRDQIPICHVRDIILKTNYKNELDKIKAFDKANLESEINSQIKKQKYLLLLEKDLHINRLCKTKSNEIKIQFENRKKSLQEQLTNIIKDSLLFAKKNSPVAAMLPPGVSDFFEKLKNEEDNSLNFSASSKTQRSKSEHNIKKNNQYIKKAKNEFLT